jgi:L-fuconolactonase
MRAQGDEARERGTPAVIIGWGNYMQPTASCCPYRRSLALALLALGLRLAGAQSLPVTSELFDAHLHPVADDVDRYPRVPPNSAPVAPPAANVHAPVGIGGLPGVPVAQTDVDARLLNWMDAEHVSAVAAIQKRGTYGTDNSYLLEAADAHPGRLRPVVILDMEDPATPQRLRRMVREHALAGLRLTGAPSADNTYPWLNSPQALRSWEVANAAGLVVDIMITNQDNSAYGIPAIIQLAKAYPHVRVVLDHMLFPSARGAPDYGLTAAYRRLSRQRNIYLKFTTINLDVLRAADVPAEDFLRHALDLYGAARVMWGSDAGNSAGAYHELVERILAATSRLSGSERRQLLHDTGERVFVQGGRR